MPIKSAQIKNKNAFFGEFDDARGHYSGQNTNNCENTNHFDQCESIFVVVFVVHKFCRVVYILKIVS